MRTAPFLIFIIDVTTRIVKRALWHTAELSGRPKASPFGRGVTKGDGEGKPVTAGLLCSDKQKSLSERYYRYACIFSASILALSGASRQLPQSGSHWRAGQAHARRTKPDISQTGVPCCQGQQQLDKMRLSKAIDPARTATRPRT